VPKVVRPLEESNKGANEGANEAIHEESHEGVIKGANVATHKESNEGVNEWMCATHGACCAYPGCDNVVKGGGMCSAHRKCSAVVEILKIRMSIGGEIICPHIGSHFPRGNIHQERIISHQSAASLPTNIQAKTSPYLGL